MPSLWSSSGARRAALGVAALLAAGAFPAAAATVLDKSTTYAIRADGGVTEHVQLAVRLDSAQDLSNWSPYSIYIDDNRKLTDLKAFATQPDGKVVKVGRKG